MLRAVPENEQRMLGGQFTTGDVCVKHAALVALARRRVVQRVHHVVRQRVQLSNARLSCNFTHADSKIYTNFTLMDYMYMILHVLRNKHPNTDLLD